MRLSRLEIAFGLGALGLIYGGFIGLIAVGGLAGGGHGWVSGSISAVAFFLVPAFGLAAAAPPRERLKSLSVIAGCMFVADILLVAATLSEGVSFLLKVWSVVPEGLILWALLWFGWQLALLVILARDLVVVHKNGSRTLDAHRRG